MDAAWSGDEKPIVGLLEAEGEAASAADGATDRLEATLDARDATVVAGDLETVLASSPTLLVAVGESALSAIARQGPAVPVLPVGDVPGVDAVDRERLAEALGVVLEGNATIRQRSVLGVDVESDDAGDETRDRRERALFDVTLVTAEPARISEYGVSSRGEQVATFRADGVVVATPAGTHGYGGAVEAPELSPAVDAVAVAPIAPFVTRTRRWVLPDDDLALTVERDDCAVTLVADDRPLETIGLGSKVRIGVDGSLSTLVVPDDALGTNRASSR